MQIGSSRHRKNFDFQRITDSRGRLSLQTIRIFRCFQRQKVYITFLLSNNENLFKIVGTGVPDCP